MGAKKPELQPGREVLEFGLRRWLKWCVWILVPLIFLLSIFSAIEFLDKGEHMDVWIFSLPTSLFTIYVLVHTFKMRLRLHRDWIEQIGVFLTRQVFFNDVSHIQLYDRKLIVRSNGKKVNVTTEFEDQRRIIDYVISRVRDIPNLKITGHRGDIREYFPCKE